ncbi:50S ribosomal protein L10 [bacterium]|nr:50S ribosomal protein L10 [bacterium]
MSESARPEKVQAVSEIKRKLEESSVVLFADYRGLSVAELTGFRKELKKDGGRLEVIKNTFAVRALQELGVTFDTKTFEGPSAIIFTDKDLVQLAKSVVKFSSGNDKLKVKAALLDNSILSRSQVEALASLPSRDELIARVIGSIKAPITNFVSVIGGPLRGLVYAISAIKDQKSGGN